MKVLFPGIHTSNLEVSHRFYTEVLGMTEARRFSPAPGINIMFLKASESGIIELIENQNAPHQEAAAPESMVTIVIGIEDMDRTLADLKEKGVTPTRGPIVSPGGEKFAFICDPDGVQIEFIQGFSL
jgi:lactoylglutathione lyase